MTRHSNSKNNRSQKGVSLIVGTASLMFLVPILGLSIDAGFLYAAKTRLQAAVDGASLAAARALNLGQTLGAQQANAAQNAVNWFYGNFPPGTWSTSGTAMDNTPAHVHVYPDATNPQLDHVDVTASTNVPTYFMKWFGAPATTITAVGNATRRAVVAMMIIDRSASMNNNNGCANMRSAAKVFTGKFAAGRDQIGMVEFGDTSWVDTSPTTNFQTVLGYTNGSSSNGLIDSIVCGDNTGTAQAISLAYNEVYKMGLPGAFNFLMFFTDGIPNSTTIDFRTVMVPPGTGNTNGCKDSLGHAISAAAPNAGNMVLHPPSWTPGWAFTGYYNASIPAGPVGVIASDDPANHGSYGVRRYQGFSQGNTNHGTISAGNAPGCSFPSSESNYVNDFLKLPPTDAWGNALTGYNALNTDASGNILLPNNFADTGSPLTGNNLTFHLVARNAADNAAFAARSNATLPVTIFGIGLGGTSAAPPGYDFMQRITNDPNGDLFNSPALYPACSTEPLCATHSNQPQGVFIFSSDPTKLQQAFLDLASQILRLAK